MAQQNNYSIRPQKFKVGVQHVLLFVALVVAIFLFLFYQVIPSATSGFVVPLFKPSGDRLEKIGFVEFKGLVWASVSKDKEPQLAGQNLEIKKDYINGEFVFDFSFKERTTDEHGYVKGANEFYAKSEVLGEHAIILEPWIGFSVIALVLSLGFTMFITMFLPSSIGMMAVLFDRQIDNTKIKIRLQTGFSDSVVDILTMPDDMLQNMDREEVERVFLRIWERTVTDAEISSRHTVIFEEIFDDDVDVVHFRNEAIYTRIKEFFSDFVVKEIEDTKDGLLWRRNHLKFFKGLRLYMAHHFTEKYANNVTGMAYGGAAFLIVAVGIRGLKFIPATKPSFILLAIFLEFTMLTLLAVTLFYTEEEERMDKMLKKMEDANRSQLDILKGQQADIHQLSNALVGQTSDIIKNRVENAISEYMTSDDNIKKVVAEEIAEKIMVGMRDQSNIKSPHGGTARRR
jgi:hypothetical protein